VRKKIIRRRKSRHLLTRVELSRALPASFSAVDRLISSGLRPAAQRGRAKLYRLTEARRLAQRQKRESASADLIALADAKSRATRSTLNRLREKYVTRVHVEREWTYLTNRVRQGATQMLDALSSTDPASIERDVRALLTRLVQMPPRRSSRPTRPLPVVKASPSLHAARVPVELQLSHLEVRHDRLHLSDQTSNAPGGFLRQAHLFADPPQRAVRFEHFLYLCLDRHNYPLGWLVVW